MITDPQIFEDTHLPQRLHHREGEEHQLLRALGRSGFQDQQAEDLLISGPSGVGKTTLAKVGLQTFRRETGSDIGSAHVRCLGCAHGTILREVISAHPADVDVHRGTPTDDLVPALQEAIDEAFVVVLDEGDDLPETGVLSTLVDVPQLSVIAICHDPEDWLARVDAPLWERFRGANHIQLQRYSVDELAEILEPRYRQGIEDRVPPYRRLEQIADLAAGVARTGIQTLRDAAELAWERGHVEIQPDDVEDGLRRARERIRKANLKSLPYHHHVLYELVRSAGGEGVSGGELHRRYDEASERVYAESVKTAVSRRSRRTKLQKLQDYDLIRCDGSGSRRQYCAIDESVRSDVVDGQLLVV